MKALFEGTLVEWFLFSEFNSGVVAYSKSAVLVIFLIVISVVLYGSRQYLERGLTRYDWYEYAGVLGIIFLPVSIFLSVSGLFGVLGFLCLIFSFVMSSYYFVVVAYRKLVDKQKLPVFEKAIVTSFLVALFVALPMFIAELLLTEMFGVSGSDLNYAMLYVVFIFDTALLSVLFPLIMLLYVIGRFKWSVFDCDKNMISFCMVFSFFYSGTVLTGALFPGLMKNAPIESIYKFSLGIDFTSNHQCDSDDVLDTSSVLFLDSAYKKVLVYTPPGDGVIRKSSFSLGDCSV